MRDPRLPDTAPTGTPAVTDPQPAPLTGQARATWDLVVADMQARDAGGAAKYGVRHQHDNGRDHLVDAYQELLDGAVYLRAEIERRKVGRALPAQMENASVRRAYAELLVNELAPHIKPHGAPLYDELLKAMAALGRAIPTRHDDNLQAVETKR
jgi:hypothetical protein